MRVTSIVDPIESGREEEEEEEESRREECRREEMSVIDD